MLKHFLFISSNENFNSSENDVATITYDETNERREKQMLYVLFGLIIQKKKLVLEHGLW